MQFPSDVTATEHLCCRNTISATSTNYHNKTKDDGSEVLSRSRLPVGTRRKGFPSKDMSGSCSGFHDDDPTAYPNQTRSTSLILQPNLRSRSLPLTANTGVQWSSSHMATLHASKAERVGGGSGSTSHTRTCSPTPTLRGKAGSRPAPQAHPPPRAAPSPPGVWARAPHILPPGHEVTGGRGVRGFAHHPERHPGRDLNLDCSIGRPVQNR